MSAVTDVRTELRRIAESKPVHAAAGAGVAATEALRELPARLAKWRSEYGVATLDKRVNGYVTEIRTRAAHSYDQLALRGKKVMTAKPAPKGKSQLNGGGKTAK